MERNVRIEHVHINGVNCLNLQFFPKNILARTVQIAKIEVKIPRLRFVLNKYTI